ncbi:MAG: tetratricopeptide repeat protein, partial [Holophagales bacterium]|nr:tetratricopeptide repeat protein [Holophagales bacterium]
MRHLALAHLCILFAVFPAPGSCQETEEPFASPIFQEHGEKKKDPPKRDADRKNLPGEVSKLDIEDLSREIERLAQEISAAAIKAAKKNSVDNEDFTREMETLRREMGKMAQEINAQARRAGNLAQSQPSDALLASARAQRLRGRYAEAAELYSQYIANNPNSSRLFESRFWYANSLFEDQKWKEAAAAFTEFLQKHPDQRTFSQVAKGDRIHC